MKFDMNETRSLLMTSVRVSSVAIKMPYSFSIYNTDCNTFDSVIIGTFGFMKS